MFSPLETASEKAAEYFLSYCIVLLEKKVFRCDEIPRLSVKTRDAFSKEKENEEAMVNIEMCGTKRDMLGSESPRTHANAQIVTSKSFYAYRIRTVQMDFSYQSVPLTETSDTMHLSCII